MSMITVPARIPRKSFGHLRTITICQDSNILGSLRKQFCRPKDFVTRLLQKSFVGVGLSLQRSLQSPSRMPLLAVNKHNVCNYWTIFRLSIDLRESGTFDSDGIDPFSNVTTPGVSAEDFVVIWC